MFLTITSLVLLFLVDYTTGSCGVCQSNFVACQSETTFSPCTSGVPTSSLIDCPEGYVCSDQDAVCVPKDGSNQPSCVTTGCDACGSYEKVFSCISQTEFAFCYGETKPFYKSVGSCAEGYVCDLNSREICVKDTESEPSCVPRDATRFCINIADVGTYKAEGDSTCTKYYVCSKSGDSFRGHLFTCFSSHYFNPDIGLCQIEKPDNC